MKAPKLGSAAWAVASFLVGVEVNAAPSLSGVPATLTDGTTVSITGTDLGTKGPAAPVLWDRVDNQYSGLSDGATIPTGGSNPWPSPYGNSSGSGTVKFENTDAARGVGKAQYKAVSQRSAYLDGLTWTKTGRAYVSWWFKTGMSVGGDTHSSKFLRMSDSNDEVNRTFSWTQLQNYVYDTSAGCNFSGYTDYCSNDWAGVTPTPNTWVFFEAWFNSTNSTYTLRMNGRTITSVSYSPGKTSFNELWKIGFDGGGTSPPTITWWMDDIYVDSSLARVMLGNASTYSASTAFEMQALTAWGSDSISFVANQGAIANGAAAYLYVVDSNGVVSNGGAGVKVTFGETFIPNPPTDVVAD